MGARESFATLVHLILEQQVSLASALAASERLGAPPPRGPGPLHPAEEVIGAPEIGRAYARDG